MPASLENVLLMGLDERWREYQSRHKTCRGEFTEGAVHDLRVCARRLMGALDIIRAVDPHRGIRNTRRQLKKLLAGLDELRDVQVMLIEVSHPPDPGTQPTLFRANLEKREHQLLRRARQQIQGSRPSQIRKRIGKIRARLVSHAREKGFEGRLLKIEDELFLRAARAATRPGAEEAKGLHRARIAFKNFRYVTEIIGPLAPGYPEEHIKRMHDYQGRMGHIRDVEIFLAALDDFVQTLPASTTGETAGSVEESILRTYQARHAGLVKAYLENRRELGSFWRAAPELPFPWE